MSHEVESMFYTREKPWHGLGQCTASALSSTEAIIMAGLDWTVAQSPILTQTLAPIQGYKANIRTSDQKVLGIVSDRYKVIQNTEAFEFTDSLLSSDVTYETAGSLLEGKKIWLLAKLPEKYTIAEDSVESYLVFSNTHDGTGGIRVAITPIRVVCQNTLNLALNTSKRYWSTHHVGDINNKLEEAKKTLLLAQDYMQHLKTEGDRLNQIKISDRKLSSYLELLIPMPESPSDLQIKNIKVLRDDFLIRYHDAPDLKYLPKNGWRFINAASDFATHAKPLRQTISYKEKMFIRTVDGNPIIDKAYQLLLA